jgi:hypothetical protein
MKGRNALTLGERLEVEAALEAAFAPLRERRTDLSPLRVRAALRWGRGLEREAPSAVRWSGAVRRLSELSVAVGMSVLIFGASLGPAVPAGRDRPEPIAATAVRSAGPSIEEQVEIHATRVEWLDALRARIEAIRAATINDLLDPSVARPALRVRADLPAPRDDAAVRSGPY